MNYPIKQKKPLSFNTKKRTILFLALSNMWVHLLSAQVGDKDSWATISDFTPKSPETQAFQKYGDYNVNLAKGLVNISVPIHTLETSDYKLPISLSYNPTGIKVNQEATWVGLGWSLQAGAQITLDVRDTPDQNTYPMPPIEEIESHLAQAEPWDFCDGYMSFLRNNSWIKDVYHFSSPTAQGKFIIADFQGNDIQVYPPDSFKVESSGGKDNRKFKITDAQGNIYFFNDTREISCSVGIEHNTNYYTTAWYVDQIKTPSNNTIDFAYTNDGWHSNTSINDQVSISRSFSDCPQGSDQSETMTTSPRNSINATKTYKLSAISHKNFRILFIPQSGRLDLASPNLVDQIRFPDIYAVPSYLKFIKIQSFDNGTYVDNKRYELKYSYFDPGGIQLDYIRKRLKLEAVVDMTDENIATKFTYSDAVLPTKNAKSMDAWGYCNGADNLTLIPPQHIWFNNGKITLGSANRNVNTNALMAGMLTEIKYPTKGKTKFNYESNSYFGIDELSRNREVNINSHIVQGSGLPDSDQESSCGPTCLVENVIPYNLNGTASARLIFDIVYSGANYLTINKYQYARVTVFKDGSSTPFFDSSKIKDNRSFDKSVELSGSGQIILEAYGQYMSVNNFQCKYINIDDTQKNVLGPGLRIESVENYDDNSKLVTKKQYSYTIPEQGDKSSGRLVFDAVRKYDPETFHSYQTTRCEGFIGVFWITSNTTVYNGQSPYYLMNEVYYTDVKEETIDFTNVLKNGYTAYNYDFAPSVNSQDGSVNVEFDWLRGNLLNKKVFNSNNKILQEEINNYYDDTSKTVTVEGIKIFTRENFITCPNINAPPPNLVDYQNIGYRHLIPWRYLKSKMVTETFYDKSNAVSGTLITNTVYNYNNPVHMQLTSQTITSSKGETLENRFFYPGDTDTAGEPLMNILLANNRLTPVKTQSFVDTNKTSESKKIFKDWGNGLIQPEIIQTSKGSATLQNRIKVVEIDNTNGNLLQQKMENGMDITYLWGYIGTYPIAKIENASYADVKSVLGINDEAIRLLTEVPQNLRTLLPNAFITTYTYKPGVGIISTTDPKGITSKFEYDVLGRLKLTKDQNNKIISENQYNYKHEN